MFDLSKVATVYGAGTLALLVVSAYYIAVAAILRVPRSRKVSVVRYEPPAGVSPAVAAWLCERGRLPRSVAAALVSLAAKGCIKIEQIEDVVTVKHNPAAAAVRLEPEEDVILRPLARLRSGFDFSQSTPQVTDCVESFRLTLLGTELLLPHRGLTVPAWIISGVASASALIYAGLLSHHVGRGLGYILAATGSCFVIGVRTLPGTLEKVASRLPGSTVPRRPWTHADARPFWFLAGSVLGLVFIGLLSSANAVVLASGFLAVNAIFYFALQGPSAAGRKILGELEEYKQFLSAADSDFISRREPSDRVPENLDLRHAYAIAFHLDLGWGEQFVTSISNAIECAEVFQRNREDKPLSLTGSS